MLSFEEEDDSFPFLGYYLSIVNSSKKETCLVKFFVVKDFYHLWHTDGE